ncbi:transcription antiterminator [Paenibacillus antri]|uniref:Transcription antiterminator n=1 Tax=Paenibacillus antri TaxID=2582848 RepID=A0A5R9GCU9_9BACL|nr:BglG family transcription antiterminator [Paenibacillus antri]TLS49205.1 transcription antiterminator [Paenibacillus antri]
MKVSQRQKKIVEALLRASSDLSAGELAKAADVSARTVHRELADVESLLADVGVGLQKKAGAGIRLDADPGRLEALERILLHAESDELSSTDRRTLLLCALLEASEPVKLFALAHELQVTTPTVTSDLDEVERWAARDGLTLVRRRGYGVQLEGDEAGKRSAIRRLAWETLDDSDLFGRPETGDRPLHPVTAKLLELIGKPHFFRLERALWANEAAGAKELSETAYTRMLVRLSVALARFGAGHRIGASGSAVPPPDAAAVADALGRELGLDLPPEEIAYVAGVLTEDESDDDGVGVAGADPRLFETTAALIADVERRMHASLAGDRQLREGLLQHLEPAIARLREGGSIRNPLLPQIKKDYETLFRSVKEAAKETLQERERGLAVPDEEIGFLAMHFGAALERAKQLPGAVRALLVCTSGIGSSKMLAVRLAKEFPQLHVVGNVSWYEAAHSPKDRYDLIVSTVDLPLPPEQYIKLSPLLNEEETDRLRRFLRGAAERKRAQGAAPTGAGPPAGAAAPNEDALERLRALKQYADGAVRLLDAFVVGRLATNGRGIRELLLDACGRTAAAGVAKAVTDRLLERERQGSVLIPDTDLALFHTRSDAIEAPTLALFRLDERIDTGADRPVSRFLLMLAPKRLPKRELELLSEISAMLLQEDFVEALQTDDEARIKRYLANQLEAYIKNNIEWSE